MQTIFDKSCNNEILSRISKMTADSQPLWGKMNASQMMHHLNLTMEAPLGKLVTKGKPSVIMRMFRSVLYNDKPFGRGNPTPKDFKVTGNFDFYKEKLHAIDNIQEIFKSGSSFPYEQHVFFGRLTGDQWGKHFYKHIDHHLRQFGL